ncbi:hypothetical protein IP88_11430 [alpha proteobacterium AAP81b]|nr:hypothetical protein IP88_11430 [alpha proteobacterium AAP81b]
MMRKVIFATAMIVAAGPSLACHPLGPATSNWASCAAMLLPADARRQVETLPAGAAAPRQAWLTAWRPKLAAGCGRLTAALGDDAARGRMPVAVRDEIAVLALTPAS